MIRYFSKRRTLQTFLGLIYSCRLSKLNNSFILNCQIICTHIFRHPFNSRSSFKARDSVSSGLPPGSHIFVRPSLILSFPNMFSSMLFIILPTTLETHVLLPTTPSLILYTHGLFHIAIRVFLYCTLSDLYANMRGYISQILSTSPGAPFTLHAYLSKQKYIYSDRVE